MSLFKLNSKIIENAVGASPEDLFTQMDVERNGVLHLENSRYLLKLIPTSYIPLIKKIFSGYVLKYKAFDITKHEFIKLFEISRSKAPIRVKVNLKDVMNCQHERKRSEESFSQRVLRRISNDRNSVDTSLRHILDESEVVCKK